MQQWQPATEIVPRPRDPPSAALTGDRAPLPACAMSIRVSGVYLVPSGNNESGNEKSSPGDNANNANNEPNNQLRQYHHHHHHHQSKTVTIVATAGPQRSNSLDYLNFEEKRQIIANQLSLSTSLSDFLTHGPAAAAAAAAKEVAANTVVIGESFWWFWVNFLDDACWRLRENLIDNTDIWES